jgi:hypothetical protein
MKYCGRVGRSWRGILLLTFVNASWLAPYARRRGRVDYRGVSQLFNHEDQPAVAPPIGSNRRSTTIREWRPLDGGGGRLGADMVEIDVAPTADGRIAVFG